MSDVPIAFAILFGPGLVTMFFAWIHSKLFKYRFYRRHLKEAGRIRRIGKY